MNPKMHGRPVKVMELPEVAHRPYTPHQTIDYFNDIGGENGNGIPSVDSIKYHIYYDGPIWNCMDASATSFNNYSGGIWVASAVPV